MHASYMHRGEPKMTFPLGIKQYERVTKRAFSDKRVDEQAS